MRLRVLVHPLTADDSDDIAEDEEVDVAVDEPLVGRRDGDLVDSAANRLIRAVEFLGELEIGTQAGCVRQQVPDGDARLAVAPKVRKEPRDRICQAESP